MNFSKTTKNSLSENARECIEDKTKSESQLTATAFLPPMDEAEKEEKPNPAPNAVQIQASRAEDRPIIELVPCQSRNFNQQIPLPPYMHPPVWSPFQAGARPPSYQGTPYGCPQTACGIPSHGHSQALVNDLVYGLARVKEQLNCIQMSAAMGRNMQPQMPPSFYTGQVPIRQVIGSTQSLPLGICVFCERIICMNNGQQAMPVDAKMMNNMQ